MLQTDLQPLCTPLCSRFQDSYWELKEPRGTHDETISLLRSRLYSGS
jgi:hypothetical protein